MTKKYLALFLSIILIAPVFLQSWHKIYHHLVLHDTHMHCEFHTHSQHAKSCCNSTEKTSNHNQESKQSIPNITTNHHCPVCEFEFAVYQPINSTCIMWDNPDYRSFNQQPKLKFHSFFAGYSNALRAPPIFT